jgi:hypothetical protein
LEGSFMIDLGKLVSFNIMRTAIKLVCTPERTSFELSNIIYGLCDFITLTNYENVFGSKVWVFEVNYNALKWRRDSQNRR